MPSLGQCIDGTEERRISSLSKEEIEAEIKQLIKQLIEKEQSKGLKEPDEIATLERLARDRYEHPDRYHHYPTIANVAASLRHAFKKRRKPPPDAP